MRALFLVLGLSGCITSAEWADRQYKPVPHGAIRYSVGPGASAGRANALEEIRVFCGSADYTLLREQTLVYSTEISFTCAGH